MKTKVGFLGLPGSFSFLSAKKYCKKAEFLSMNSFSAIINQLKEELIDFGLIPIENSISGSLVKNYDLLLNNNVNIVGEVYWKVSHHLLAKERVNPSSISVIYSHAEVFSQCQHFLKTITAKKIAVDDTANAARLVSRSRKNNLAAIASWQAAKIYRLVVVKKGLEDDKQNFSRFFIVSTKKGSMENANKASIVFTLPHQPGTLYKALGILARQRLNLTKIESRPIIGTPFHYLFFVDFEFDNLKKAKLAIQGLKRTTSIFRLLGIYQKGKLYD